MATTDIEPSWVGPTHDALRANGITVAAHVPDGGLQYLIRRLDDDDTVTTVRLATEEEGVALAAGAWLGGARTALLMQSSGVGNCINMLSLLHVCDVPAVFVITMRGQAGETNPWQVPMSAAVAPCLEAMGVTVVCADEPDLVAPLVERACHGTFDRLTGPVAVLIAQQVVGVKTFAGDQAEEQGLGHNGRADTNHA
ncbi:MAG: phosphonopyruvate decarboxylase [Actinomycetota bacterium]